MDREMKLIDQVASGAVGCALALAVFAAGFHVGRAWGPADVRAAAVAPPAAVKATQTKAPAKFTGRPGVPQH